MTEYRLHSSAMVYTPGFLEWAKVGARSDNLKIAKIISEGYNLPEWVAVALLSGLIDYRVEGETVVFEVEEV